MTSAPTVVDRELVVIDASILIALLIDPSPNLEPHARRLGAAALIAPGILPFEVANVLRRRRNAGLLSAAEADAAFDELRSFPVDLWPFEPIADGAWRLGANLSSYDASYVVLAEVAGAVLVTRDRRLSRAPGIRCPVDVV